jgi:hypothetical protein
VLERERKGKGKREGEKGGEEEIKVTDEIRGGNTVVDIDLDPAYSLARRRETTTSF